MIPTTQSAIAASLALPPPVSILYPGDTSRAIAVPVGAVAYIAEAYAPGDASGEDEFFYYGGDGGGYSRKNRTSTSGLTALYLAFVGQTSTTVRANNSGGAVLVHAVRGRSPANTNDGVGDVKYNGGAGGQNPSVGVSGGGAAGPNGNGANEGASAGGPSGYGRGASVPPVASGEPGCVVVTWFFE